MGDREKWLQHAREAMQDDGDSDFRIMLLAEAVKRLVPYAETMTEAETLAALTHAIRGFVDADGSRRLVMLSNATRAWVAFEVAWKWGEP